MSLFRLSLIGMALISSLSAFGAIPLAPTIRVESVSPARIQPQKSSPATIFYDDFDTSEDFGRRYFEYDSQNGSFLRVPDSGYGGGGAMRSQFGAGQVSAGNLKVVFGKNPFRKGVQTDREFREIYWRVYVKHEAGWEGNPAKLARATCMAGTDWSQGLIAHVWGGQGDALCIDPASGITNDEKITTKYNDFDHLRWLGLRNSSTPIFSPAESGRWVCIESHVKMNAPGQKNGIFQLWIDGKLEASRDDLDWNGTWGDYGINAVFLENYWNTGAVKREARWFDQFVISTQPIGPITASSSPQLTRTPGTVLSAWEAEVAADAEGKNLLWVSRPLKGNVWTVAVDGKTGRFTRPEKSLKSPSSAICWVRLRQQFSSGGWSKWTAWHSPFRLSAKSASTQHARLSSG